MEKPGRPGLPLRPMNDGIDGHPFDPMLYKAAFGAAVYSRRLEAALNRALLARMADLSSSHLFRIESGDTAPSIVAVRKLAGAFGCTASDLLDDAEEILRRSR